MNSDIVKINNKIEDIRNDIYDYNLSEMFSNVECLITEMLNFIKSNKMEKDKINFFNIILENINISMRNKDYKLLADIVKFQLNDFLGNI